MLTRRNFLRASGAAIAAAAGLGFYTWRVEPHWLEFVYRSLPIRGLPASLQGRTLVQLSDIHVGGRVDDEYVTDTFRRVAALRPDIVVVTGDLISYHSISLRADGVNLSELPDGSTGHARDSRQPRLRP